MATAIRTDVRDINRVMAARIRSARRCKGLTQEQLAERSGVRLGRLSDYENANVEIPAADLLLISDVLERSMDWFGRSDLLL